MGRCPPASCLDIRTSTNKLQQTQLTSTSWVYNKHSSNFKPTNSVYTDIFSPVKMSRATRWTLACPCFPVLEVDISTILQGRFYNTVISEVTRQSTRNNLENKPTKRSFHKIFASLDVKIVPNAMDYWSARRHFRAFWPQTSERALQSITKDQNINVNAKSWRDANFGEFC